MTNSHNAPSKWPLVTLAAKSTARPLVLLALLMVQAAISMAPPEGGQGQANHDLGSAILSSASGAAAVVPDSSPHSKREIQARPKRRTASQATGRATPGRLPEFSAPIGNVSAVLGRDVRLVCSVENLGQHQVAWLKEETKTILSIDTNIIITNYRIFLIPDEEGRKWVLHIKDVQESDRGFYQCQVNTNPMRSNSGYLEVAVPPTIIEFETTQEAEVSEHANLTLQCRANGHPKPTISWRREGGEPIRLNGREPPPSSAPTMEFGGDGSALATREWRQVGTSNKLASGQQRQATAHLNDIKSDRLSLTHVDRSMAGVYVCTASNGIPGQESRRIPVHVKFPPKVSIAQKSISVNLGEQLEIDCLIEAFPKPTSYWSERQLTGLPFAARGAISSTRNQGAGLGEFRDRPRLALVGDQRQFAQRGAISGQWAKLASNPMSPPPDLIRRRQVDSGEAPDLVGGSEQELGASAEAREEEEFAAQVNSSLLTASTSNEKSTAGPLAQTGPAYVTVKQTALSAHAYKLKILIAKVRPNDFGEYACISSNSMGASSARVLVVNAEQSPTPTPATQPHQQQEALGDSSGPQLEGQSDGLRRDVSYGQEPVSAWIVQAQTKSLPDKLQQTRQAQRHSSSVARQSTRVYDENYLQAIRERQPQQGYVSSSASSPGTLQRQKLHTNAYGGERNGGTRIVATCWTALLLQALSLATLMLCLL